jgi:hypothetical protein
LMTVVLGWRVDCSIFLASAVPEWLVRSTGTGDRVPTEARLPADSLSQSLALSCSALHMGSFLQGCVSE